MTSRREFIGRTALAAAGLSLPSAPVAREATTAAAPRRYLDIHRAPDRVTVQSATRDVRLVRENEGRWTSDGIAVTTIEHGDAIRVSLTSPAVAAKRIHLRWRGDLSNVRLILGDAWERGYGDLEWRGGVPDRVMPWYVATSDGERTHTYGVRTGVHAFWFWPIDSPGVRLCAHDSS